MYSSIKNFIPRTYHLSYMERKYRRECGEREREREREMEGPLPFKKKVLTLLTEVPYTLSISKGGAVPWNYTRLTFPFLSGKIEGTGCEEKTELPLGCHF